MRTRAIVYLALILATTASAGIIEHHVYTPTSLPSDQGWEFHTTEGFTEADLFAIVDDLLVMDTMATNFNYLNTHFYSRSVDHPEIASARLHLRARVIDHALGAAPFYRGFGFGGHAPGFGPQHIYGLEDAALYVNDAYLIDLDATAWHDYEVITEGYHLDAVSTLLIDGEVATITTGDAPGALDSTFIFGDLGTYANARVEISELELITYDSAPVATESHSLSAIKSLF